VAELLEADSEVEWSGAEASGVQDLEAADTAVALPVAGLETSALQDDPAGGLQVRSQAVLGGVSQAVPVGAVGGPATVRVGAGVGEDGVGRLRPASSLPAHGVIRTATRAMIAALSGTAISM
jgi:hypothetical protein